MPAPRLPALLAGLALILAPAPPARAEVRACLVTDDLEDEVRVCVAADHDSCSPWDGSCCEALGDECPFDVIPWVLWGQLSGEDPVAYCVGPEDPPKGGVPDVVAEIGEPCEGAPTAA